MLLLIPLTGKISPYLRLFRLNENNNALSLSAVFVVHTLHVNYNDTNKRTKKKKREKEEEKQALTLSNRYNSIINGMHKRNLIRKYESQFFVVRSVVSVSSDSPQLHSSNRNQK